MITEQEARDYQIHAQRKAVLVFFGAALALAATCVGLYFLDVRMFYVVTCVSVFLLCFVAGRTKIYEFFRPKECTGEVTWFTVHTERIKSGYSSASVETYKAYFINVADMAIVDSKGKTRYKSFRFNSAYDKVTVGDKATFYRFVERPVVKFKTEK